MLLEELFKNEDGLLSLFTARQTDSNVYFFQKWFTIPVTDNKNGITNQQLWIQKGWEFESVLDTLIEKSADKEDIYEFINEHLKIFTSKLIKIYANVKNITIEIEETEYGKKSNSEIKFIQQDGLNIEIKLCSDRNPENIKKIIIKTVLKLKDFLDFSMSSGLTGVSLETAWETLKPTVEKIDIESIVNIVASKLYKKYETWNKCRDFIESEEFQKWLTSTGVNLYKNQFKLDNFKNRVLTKLLDYRDTFE